MAGMATKVIAKPFLSLSRSRHTLGGAFDVLVGRKRGEGRRRERSQQHEPHQRQRIDFAAPMSITKANRQQSFSASVTFHGRPSSASAPTRRNRIQRRHSHSQTTTTAATSDPQPQPAENRDGLGRRRPDKSDPTAKRPTKKCDPYGLQGESLSRAQCLDWMSTLEDGWRLLPPPLSKPDDDDDEDLTINERTPPKFLQNIYYHSTLNEASRFLSHISLLATNLNHFPFLSMERILLEDLNDVHESGKDKNCGIFGGNSNDESDTNAVEAGEEMLKTPKQRRRKVKGWVFCSTVRCSTYRPPTNLGPPSADPAFQSDGKNDIHRDKGLTYHDFHLAMSIDVEVNRKEVKCLLWTNPQE